MADFIRVANMNEVRFSERWRDSAKFDSYGRFISKEGKYVEETFPGCKYRVCVKKERYYSSLERAGRVFLGLIATALSLGSAPIFSKNIRGLFTRQKKVLRFAIKTIFNNPSPIVQLPPINLPPPVQVVPLPPVPVAAPAVPYVADPNEVMRQHQLQRMQQNPQADVPLPILEV